MICSDDKKEMISVMINICTRVVTLIFVVVTIFRKCFEAGDAMLWSLKDIWGVIIIGMVSGLGFGIFYIKKNMSNKQLIIFKILYFIIINSVLCFIGLKFNWFKKDFSSIALMEVMFILVFFVVTVLVYLLDFNEAKKINEKLKARRGIK